MREKNAGLSFHAKVLFFWHIDIEKGDLMKVFNGFQKVIRWTGTASSLLVCLVALAHAEVVLDGTVGQKGAVSGPNYVIIDKMGSRAGANLFHSFETFNINTGESGSFTGPAGIQNVIGRVTGGASSLIDGRLGCTIPRANLFLINPWGMMFGPNATLDVNGSFHASTADYLILGDTGRFDAIHPEQSVLTVVPPSAFGFLDDTVAPITVQGSYLKVPEGETLSLVGGDITLNDATLYAPGGELDLVSVASAGEVTPGASGLGVDSFSRFGNINIKRSDVDHVKIDDTEIGDVDVSGEGSGVVYVRGGNFYVDGGHVYANTMGDEDSRGGIDVKAQETISIDHHSKITSKVFRSGDGGDISFDAKDIFIESWSWIDSSTTYYSTGKSGDISITALENLAFEGEIKKNSWGVGTPGKIVLEGKDVSLNGGDIYSYGNVDIKAIKDISIDSSELITTTSKMDAGNIIIKGKDITISGSAHILSISRNNFTGKCGDISMVANGNIFLGDTIPGPGTEIETYTEGAGDAGNIVLKGNNISLEGAYIHSSTNDDATGNSGDIDIKTSGNIVTRYYAGISTNSYGSGDAGNIALEGKDMGA